MHTPDQIYVVAITTAPRPPKGFHNSVKVYFKSDSKTAYFTTPELQAAARMNKRDAELTASWIADTLDPDQTVAIDLIPEGM